MKIVKIECIPITVHFKKPVGLAYGEIKEQQEVIVKIHTDVGIVGVGETGGISTGYIGECQDSIMELIRDYIGPMVLLGEDPFNIEKIVAEMDKIVKWNNQAKAVVDFALHDIMGKALGVPVYKLIGGLCMEKIPLGWVLGAQEPEAMAKEAVERLENGFKYLKVKVGLLSPKRDIENVKAVREAVGEDAKIIVDVNTAWDLPTALNTLREMEKYNIWIAEQPVPYWNVEGLKALRNRTNILIMADEAIYEIWDLIKIIRADAADLVFIKVVKAGGILKGKRWVSIAKAAGLPVICGCMMGCGIEAAAQAHFIASTEWMEKIPHQNLGPLHIHYVTESAGVKDDIVKELPKYENGFLYVPNKPGLGVELNDEMVSKYLTAGKKPIVIEKRK